MSNYSFLSLPQLKKNIEILKNIYPCIIPLNLINPALVQIIVFFINLIPVLEIVISVVRPSVHLLVLLLHLVLILILLLILIIIFLLLYTNRGF